MQRVPEGDRLEEGGQVVESVGSFVEDAEEEVYFARGEEGQVVVGGGERVFVFGGGEGCGTEAGF